MARALVKARTQNDLAMSYLDLRRGIGGLGVALPVVLVIGAILIDPQVSGIQPSISDYHGTEMRGVFVGVLWALGVFLYAHIGDRPPEDRGRFTLTDNMAGNLAGILAIAVALFPNTGGGLVDNVHFLSAVLLFVMLAYFAFWVFPRSERSKAESIRLPNLGVRIVIYRVCSGVMVLCLVLTGLYYLLDGKDSGLAGISPVFWLESAALWSFGISWFIYGETLLTD